jgi:hypothetical protein
MFKGTVTFKSNFPGIEFESVEFAYPDSKVLLANIKSSYSEGVTLIVEITNADSLDEVFSKAKEVADWTAKLLTFKLGVLFQSFRQVDDKIIEEQLQADGSIKSNHCIIAHHRIEGSITSFSTLSTQELSEIKTFLEQKKYNGFVYYDLFYFALNLTDSISKYMILYYIILSICNDRQKEVDKFILKCEPNVPTFKRYKPQNNHYRNQQIYNNVKEIPETIYTRLRNQVAHTSSSNTIEQTRNEIQKRLKGLIEITHKLINDQT